MTEELLGQGELFRPFIRPVLDPELVDDGDRLHGWEIVAAPGHADGQLTLLKDGVLIAADHLLARITPTVGLWPASRPDPLGDYLGSLQRTIDLAPDDRLRRPRRHRHRPGRPGQRADRPSRRAAARHRRRDRHGAAHGVRGVVPAVRRRPAARRRAGSPSPRRSPTSSGSSGTAGPNATSCSRTGTSPASPILPRSSGRTSLQYRRPGDRGMTVVPRASRRCRSDPPERLLRRGRVLARDRAPDPAQGADRRGQSPGARRDEDHERPGALHRGDAARRHAHLARHRRHRRAGALRPVRGLPRNLRGRRARLPRDHVHARRRRRARPQGARAQLLGADRARRLRSRAGLLLRRRTADLGAAALERGRAAADRHRSRLHRRRGPLRGRAEDAARGVDRSEARSSRASARCSTRSSTSPTRRRRT